MPSGERTRPPGRPETARGTGGARVTVRLSEAERARLAREAKRDGITLAELLRRCALTRPPVVKVRGR